MKDKLLALLKALEQAIPPVVRGTHHAITYAQYGSDETGWEDRLALHVATQREPFTSVTFFLDAADLEGPVDDCVAAVRRGLAAAP